jgi:hypothetical protein
MIQADLGEQCLPRRDLERSVVVDKVALGFRPDRVLRLEAELARSEPEPGAVSRGYVAALARRRSVIRVDHRHCSRCRAEAIIQG